MASSNQNMFLKLPQEVQDMIWDLVLVTQNPLCPVYGEGRIHWPIALTNKIWNVSSLLASKAVYSATVLRFYARNIFNFTRSDYNESQLQPDLSNPEYAESLAHLPHMQHISMHTEMAQSWDWGPSFAIEVYLHQVAQKCLSLRTLTLAAHDDLDPPLKNVIWNMGLNNSNSQGQPTLRALECIVKQPALQRLTIIIEQYRDEDPNISDDRQKPTVLTLAPHIKWTHTPKELCGDEFDDLGWEMPDRVSDMFALRADPAEPEKREGKQNHVTWTYRPQEKMNLEFVAKREEAARRAATREATAHAWFDSGFRRQRGGVKGE